MRWFLRGKNEPGRPLLEALQGYERGSTHSQICRPSDNGFARECDITSLSRSVICLNRFLTTPFQIESYQTAPGGSAHPWPWRKPKAALHGLYSLSDASAPKG
ncbi:MAG: hypothetical protein KDD67_13135 [Ignavibacteriae bacterium]|nr:hypothetical protein [Ignavibacteriota bacterium]MCB9214421.1 hypothetical protein [Ignavibacteria bacterium]